MQVNLGNGSFANYNHAGGEQAVLAVEVVRPADTTAYAAQDVISTSASAGTLLDFGPVVRFKGGSGYITKARLETNQSTNVARYRLHLFHTAPAAINDNSPFTLLYANTPKRVGKVDFAACATEGTGSDCAASLTDSARLAFSTDSTNDHIYGILETLDAFTPASGQKFYVELTAEKN